MALLMGILTCSIKQDRPKSLHQMEPVSPMGDKLKP